jgi:hypothetical protein
MYRAYRRRGERHDCDWVLRDYRCVDRCTALVSRHLRLDALDFLIRDWV